MTYSPVELRHVRIPTALLGYRRDAVERLVDEVAASFEDVWRERGELDDRVAELERELGVLKEREQIMVQAVVTAEQAATEIRAQAMRQAELIVAEAHREARSIVRGVQGEHARLATEVRRIAALLRAALGIVEEGALEVDGEEDVGAWPRVDDTREFPRGVPSVEETEPEAQAG